MAATSPANGTAAAGFIEGGKEEPDVTTVAGALTQIQEGSYIGGCKDGDAKEAEFCFPNGLALGKDKALYVSDSDNRRIRKVDLKTGKVSTFAGGGGTGYLESRDYPFADNQGEHARFGEVRGIGLDQKDNLYVADMFHYRVRKVTPDAEVSTFAGQQRVKAPLPAPNADGTVTAPTYDPNEQYADGPATSGAKFNRPSAVAVDKANNVFVCDFSNNRIRKVSPDGVVTTHAGSGEKGYKDGTAKEAAFNWPNHICIDKNNNIYVAEAENFRIRKVSASGVVSTYAGCGEKGFEDGTADKAKFDGPNAVACDSDGYVYVTEDENHRVRIISPSGVVRTLAGTGVRGAENGKTVADAQFAMPTGLIVDPDTSHVYVCDYGNHIIRKIHHRVVHACKAAMSKEDGRFPPMPVIAEEAETSEDKDDDAAGEDEKVGGSADQKGDSSAAPAAGEKKKKKNSKSKKREKSEMGASVEGAVDSKEGAAEGGAAARKGSAVAPGGGAAAAGAAAGDGAGKEGEDASKKEDDNKSCRMCQKGGGCFVM